MRSTARVVCAREGGMSPSSEHLPGHVRHNVPMTSTTINKLQRHAVLVVPMRAGPDSAALQHGTAVDAQTLQFMPIAVRCDPSQARRLALRALRTLQPPLQPLLFGQALLNLRRPRRQRQTGKYTAPPPQPQGSAGRASQPCAMSAALQKHTGPPRRRAAAHSASERCAATSSRRSFATASRHAAASSV